MRQENSITNKEESGIVDDYLEYYFTVLTLIVTLVLIVMYSNYVVAAVLHTYQSVIETEPYAYEEYRLYLILQRWNYLPKSAFGGARGGKAANYMVIRRPVASKYNVKTDNSFDFKTEVHGIKRYIELSRQA